MQPEKLILASASPRRRDLLAELGLSFEVFVSNVIEDDRPELEPQYLVMQNAILKAESVMSKFPNALVLGSDTTVSLEGKIFSKPATLEEAGVMLGELSGRVHRVYTAVSLRWQSGSYQEDFYEVSEVRFKNLSDRDISAYHALVNPLDKAGAYGIQEERERIIESISGSFQTIMGLPTQALVDRLNQNGFDFKSASLGNSL